MSEPHQIITEHSGHGLVWWCSCGWDGTDPTELHDHLDHTGERTRA